MRLRLLSLIIMMLCILATLSACDKKSLSQIEMLEDETEVFDAVSSEKSGQDKQVDQENSKFKINAKKDRVEITLSGQLLSKDAVDHLTQEQKDMGYLSVTLNDDGSVTYDIAADKYKIVLAEFKKQTIMSLDSMTNGDKYQTIRGVLYDKNLQNIKLVVTTQKEYNAHIADYIACWQAGALACLYQEMSGNQDYTVKVKIQDSATGNVFKTFEYPQAFSQQ